MPRSKLPTRLLAGRIFDPIPGGLACTDLFATDEHDEEEPDGGSWMVPMCTPYLQREERRSIARAVQVARMLLPHYSGLAAPGDPLEIVEEADGLAGHPCWASTDIDPDSEDWQRLGVVQVIGWLRPYGPEEPAAYLVRTITPVRTVDERVVAGERQIVLLHPCCVTPIPVGEEF